MIGVGQTNRPREGGWALNQLLSRKVSDMIKIILERFLSSVLTFRDSFLLNLIEEVW